MSLIVIVCVCVCVCVCVSVCLCVSLSLCVYSLCVGGACVMFKEVYKKTFVLEFSFFVVHLFFVLFCFLKQSFTIYN